MSLAVCDTGPLLHLSEIGRLDLLSFVGQVVLPLAVVEEMDRHLPQWSARKPDWIRVEALLGQFADKAAAWETSGILHAGEAQSIALSVQAKCDWYLTDDAAARILASSLGLEVHGTVGIILWAAARGFATRHETELLLDRLAGESSLWVSPRIVAEAKSALDDLFQA